MTISLAQPATLTCPACSAAFTADIWLIVAAAERPDLVERIRAGSAHAVTCPQCGQTHSMDAPLLIFRPNAEPPILFSPAQQTSREEDEQQAAALIAALRERLGAAWNDAWSARGLTVVPRQLLPAALADDPAAALRELAGTEPVGPIEFGGELRNVGPIEFGGELRNDWKVTAELAGKNLVAQVDRITAGDVSGTGIAIGHGAQATVHQHYHEPRFTRYTDISCPRRVGVNERFALTIALKMQLNPDSVKTEALSVVAGKLKVRLSAPGLELLDAAEQTIVVEPDDDSPPVVFHLKGRAVGRYEITAQFWQRGNLIAAVVMPLEVLAAQPVFEAAHLPAAAVSFLPTGARAPDLTLVVQRDPEGRMVFEAVRDGIVQFTTATRLKTEPRAFIDQLYDEIGLLQRGRDSAGLRRLDSTQIADRLRDLGYRLWDRLIPADFKQWYAQHRAEWRVTGDQDRRWSLLVQSNEADLPWELIRPYGSGSDCWEEGCWCETFHFARWLLRRPDTLECVAPPLQIRLSALAAITPPHADLAAAPQERDLLRVLIARHQLRDRSPERATEAALRALLEQGGYDWMHVITHGRFFAASTLHSGAIALENEETLASSAITGPRIRGALRRERPAFVLNACHAGRVAPALSGAASWATELIGSGAGMLIAPLWSARDDLAARFSAVFYEALLNKAASLGEAVWYARMAIREDGDPTWLAYSLFGRPHATVTVQGQGG